MCHLDDRIGRALDGHVARVHGDWDTVAEQWGIDGDTLRSACVRQARQRLARQVVGVSARKRRIRKKRKARRKRRQKRIGRNLKKAGKVFQKIATAPLKAVGKVLKGATGALKGIVPGAGAGGAPVALPGGAPVLQAPAPRRRPGSVTAVPQGAVIVKF